MTVAYSHLMLAFALASIIDGGLTYNALKRGAVERIPWTRKLIEELGLAPALLLTRLLAIGGVAWALYGPGASDMAGTVVLWITGAYWLIVMPNNIYHYIKQRRP